ncbi:MAG: UDP-N-acetylmuramoyl-L-alanine--D-glutamate ligase [Bacilli bacterium]|nr:UDP-N-acetylmuramoyl-L-alanine--D-glutamate ligase [Bacilli bacterium]
MYNEMIKDLKNKSICILGFGKEGKSTYNYLTKHGITNIKVHDKIEQDVDGVYGDIYLDNLDKYDIIIKSPGISLKDIDISKFENKISSELELLLEYSKCTIIGITGSKGKSTTTSLIYEMLKANQLDTYLLGNIGIPIFDYLDSFKEDSYLVIEMAALQLEYVKHSPHIGVITNLFEEHLDHFGTLEKYYNAKLNIFKYQSSNDYSIYSHDNKELDTIMKDKYKGHKIPVSLDDIKDNYITIDEEKIYDINNKRNLIGKHNLMNIIMALNVAKILKLDINKCIMAITNFKPLPHRMENVGTYDGVTYYDDAIATIPEATIDCIDALGNVDTLITGGKDRGIDYQVLIDYINSSNVSNVICMPETGYRIEPYITKNTYKIVELEDAVNLAKKVTKKGSICLLSPSASSYNKFKNFEEKGNYFQKYVKSE